MSRNYFTQGINTPEGYPLQEGVSPAYFHNGNKLRSQPTSRKNLSWAFCCSLLTHVSFLILLVAYAQQNPPHLQLTAPIRIDLISLPAAKEKTQVSAVSEKKPPQPIQAAIQPLVQKKLATPQKIKPPEQPQKIPSPSKNLVHNSEPAAFTEPAKIVLAPPTINRNETQPQVVATQINKIPAQQQSQTGHLEQLAQMKTFYALEIRKKINRVKHYPLIARRRGEQGTVTLEFSIDAQGKVLNSRILLSSGAKILDRAALKALAEANPFSPPPAELRIEQTYQLPIQFALN